MIGIISALREEIVAIVEQASAEAPLHTQEVLGHRLHTGRLAGREVLLAQCGVGKVAAAITATLMAQQVEALIMVGTAGGIGAEVHTGDVVVATELVQHDMDARPLFARWVLPSVGLSHIPTDARLSGVLLDAAAQVVTAPSAQLTGFGITHPRAHAGVVASGDVFMSTSEHSLQLRTDLPTVLAVEMEGAAVAQVCHTAGLPFAVVRTISDRADAAAAVDFPRFLQTVAAPYARDLVTRALPNL
ncbi:MAG TPA: 5'-methylthioadenosine/adenosylhomocysteine nucleosidase [Propionibacteriaceae bacterium]|nr:5'-methylthioadenosine/adenosylhomocysteine nucleosidase [Propionibacteriaceae bacterium]